MFLLCVFVSDDLFTYAYEHTKKKAKEDCRNTYPHPTPKKKQVHFRVSKNTFFLFCLCVCSSAHVMNVRPFSTFSLSQKSACARACPARRPQKKARRGREEEEEEEVGCFFSKRRRILREVLPVERRRRRPKFIRWSAGLVVIIIG